MLKSRGMEHSNQIREFLLTNDGLRLLDVYLGPEGVLTGAARVSQEGREKAAGTSRRQQLEGRGRELERKREIFEARMTMLRAEFEVEEEVIQQSISESKLLDAELLQDRGQMVRSREADAVGVQEGAERASRAETLNGDSQETPAGAAPHAGAADAAGVEAAALRGGPDAEVDSRASPT